MSESLDKAVITHLVNYVVGNMEYTKMEQFEPMYRAAENVLPRLRRMCFSTNVVENIEYCHKFTMLAILRTHVKSQESVPCDKVILRIVLRIVADAILKIEQLSQSTILLQNESLIAEMLAQASVNACLNDQ